MRQFVLLSSVIISANAYSASVKELQDASMMLCEKVKQCTFEQMQAEQGISSEMRSMVEGMLNTMCKDFIKFDEVDRDHELVEPALACMKSMSALSCDQLQEDNMATPACEAYERVAKAYN